MAQGRQHRGCGARGGAQGPAPPLTDLSLCLLLPHPREILGLVDLVALENGELGPLLSAGTLRGLEDECVTDVKVPSKVATRDGEGLCRKREITMGLEGSPLPTGCFPFPVVT